MKVRELIGILAQQNAEATVTVCRVDDADAPYTWEPPRVSLDPATLEVRIEA
jgi:hypothetical protein